MAGRFSIQTVFEGRDQLSSVLTKLQARSKAFTDAFKKNLSGLDAHVGKINSAIGGVGKTVAAAGVATGLGLAAMSQQGLQFEHTLASLAAVAKPTADELDALSKSALRTGADFGFSAIDTAAAMEAMTKQGLSVQQVLSGIGGVAAAAAADSATLDETIGGLLSTMAGMGAAPADLQHIADVMAKAGDQTAAGIGSLTQSMAIFGPTARAMGIPIEAAVGQLALLQDAGLDASTSGTSLAAVYSKLSAPFGRTGKALKHLGINVKDALGNMKPPQQLMNEIFQATSKIQGNVGKAAAITELVGLESQKALLNITAAVGSGKFARLMGDLNSNVDGYATSIAKLKQDSTIGDLNKLKAGFQALQITLFGLVSKDLRGLLAAGSTWIEQNKQLITSSVVSFMEDVRDAGVQIRDNWEEIVTWGKRIGIVIGVFYGLKMAIGVAQVALAAYELTMMAASSATSIASGATAVFSTVTNTSNIALVAGKVATAAATVARGAYTTAIAIGALATTRVTVAEIASKVATVATTAVVWLATTARGAFTAATTAAAASATALGVAAMGSVPGIAASTAALAPFLATVLATTAAVAALYAAWTQWQGLDKTMGGEVGSSFMKMLDNGDFSLSGFAKANDQILNEKARQEAASRGVVSPSETIARSISENKSTAEVNINAPQGTTMTSKGKAPGIKLNLQPTGAF